MPQHLRFSVGVARESFYFLQILFAFRIQQTNSTSLPPYQDPRKTLISNLLCALNTLLIGPVRDEMADAPYHHFEELTPNFSRKFINAFCPLYIFLQCVGQLPFEIYRQVMLILNPSFSLNYVLTFLSNVILRTQTSMPSDIENLESGRSFLLSLSLYTSPPFSSSRSVSFRISLALFYSKRILLFWSKLHYFCFSNLMRIIFFRVQPSFRQYEPKRNATWEGKA